MPSADVESPISRAGGRPVHEPDPDLPVVLRQRLRILDRVAAPCGRAGRPARAMDAVDLPRDTGRKTGLRKAKSDKDFGPWAQLNGTSLEGVQQSNGNHRSRALLRMRCLQRNPSPSTMCIPPSSEGAAPSPFSPEKPSLQPSRRIQISLPAERRNQEGSCSQENMGFISFGVNFQHRNTLSLVFTQN